MIELQNNHLTVSFPEVSHRPRMQLRFQRTLRIPDDGRHYSLPPALGSFPLRHIDDYAARVPPAWLNRGGLLLPMWQSEALWIAFDSNYLADRQTSYPFAVKVATGKINAITGEPWRQGLSRNPQDYAVIPQQPWLDGYCVQKGVIRQFVAMPMGQGFSVEEQLTGKAEFGGLQLEIFPMQTKVFETRFPVVPRLFSAGTTKMIAEAMPPAQCFGLCEEGVMGLAPGGRMRQEIYEDPFSIHDWDEAQRSRCFIHLVNAATWQSITGELSPSRPLSAADYNRYGRPWFDYYNTDLNVLGGSASLAGLKSVHQKHLEKGLGPLPGNESSSPAKIVKLRAGLRRGQVRETEF